VGAFADQEWYASQFTIEFKALNPKDNWTPYESVPDKAYAWRERIFVPASLAGWPEIWDPEDPRPSPQDRVMEFIFGGDATIGTAGSTDSTWAKPFLSDANYNAIKVESADRSYSRVYDLSQKSVEIDGKEVLMSQAQ